MGSGRGNDEVVVASTIRQILWYGLWQVCTVPNEMMHVNRMLESTGRVASRTPSPASTPLMLPALPPSYASRKPVPSGQRRHSTSAIFIDIEHGLGGITEALTYIHSLDVPGISAILCPPR